MPRTLSEEEFNAIKERVLASLPANLSERDFNRMVSSSMSGAIAEAENSREPVTGSGAGRFGSGLYDTTIGALTGLAGAVRHPVDAVTNAGRAQLAELSAALNKAREATSGTAQPGSVGGVQVPGAALSALEALGHGTAGLLPLIGPAAAHAGERGAQGDVAGMAGEATGLLAPAGADLAVTKGPAAARAVLPTGTAAKIATRLEDSAATRLATEMGPKVGPNKVRLTNQLADKAPSLLREPGLNAFTKEGYAAKVAGKLDDAIAAMDDAADNRLASQQVRTAPILRQLDQEITKLTAQPVEGSTYPRQATEAAPIGTAVEPAPNSAQIATLRKIRHEVAALGSVAPYDSIRTIRTSWDQVARAKYMPATAQDALKSQGEATAAMKGTGALREGLAGTDPESAVAFRSYSLFKAADDVLAAAQEAERARPQVGRGLMRTTGGAVAGSVSGGATGAAIGATIGYIVDRAASYVPTMQVLIARRMQSIADALRQGDVTLAWSQAATLKASLPPEFAPTDAVVASPAQGGRGGPPAVRNQELLKKLGGRQVP